MKCKPYSEITVEIRTQLKTVKITSNIFAVWCVALWMHLIPKKKHVSEVAKKVAKSLCVCLEKAISFSTQDVCIF